MTNTKGASIAIIAAAELAAMTLWFSATAVVPSLARDYHLDVFSQGLFTSAVQAGFVAGTLASAILGLPDRLDPRRLFCAAALIGAVANLAILALDPASLAVVACASRPAWRWPGSIPSA